MIKSGKDKHEVWIEKHEMGKDIVLFLGGGEPPHVGAVVIAEPGVETITAVRKKHHDDVVAKDIAEFAANKWKKVVCVVAGIHIDTAEEVDIAIIKNNCEELKKKLE
ncbi:MAG: hypothetical protein JW834_03725 [Candidatus Diapherotrites archaeon]|nr:hypothetical protein [Candidatus Diapherotrites archaeon]